MRAEDSQRRLFVLRKYGPIKWDKREFKPIWDWKIDGVISEIRASGIKLPVDYQFMERSWEGFDYKHLHVIRQYFPKDYERILKFFPMVEANRARYEFAIKKGRLNSEQTKAEFRMGPTSRCLTSWAI